MTRKRPFGPLTAADTFTADVQALSAEAMTQGLIFGVTSGGHSVVARANRASRTATMRINDHAGRYAETTTAPDGDPSALRRPWSRVEELGVRPAPAEAPGRSGSPARVHPAVAALLESAADHLALVGLHQGGREWAQAPWTGPATVTHALAAAVRARRGLLREQRGALVDAALIVLADHVHGRPVVVPHWWRSGAQAYLRATVWNWGDARGRTTAGTVAFLRGAATAIPARQG
ncbi:DUF6197 family protein [Kitasatospora sp. NPDC059146]|uniref:DUF6197 family protein n=1 Tax=unclassified Kitasatospora TaxID=2633591 RepID=UPI0036788445